MKRPSRKKKAISIVKKLRQAGFSAYFVGGCVRDKLRNLPEKAIKDYDIATSARPPEIDKLFSRCLKVGAKFGVMVVLMGKETFEVATFRCDYDYDGRKPARVEFVGAKEDVFRRDFTINGLLYDPLEDKYIDYVGGQKDLQRKIIRAIGEPELRFREDHLRMLRALRFSANLDYTIEEKTYRAVCQLAPKIREISRERIRNELVRILEGTNPALGTKLLMETGLMEVVLPEITQAWKGEEERLFQSLKALQEDSHEVGFALWFSKISPETTYGILHENFHMSNRSCGGVKEILSLYNKLIQNHSFSLAEIKKIVRQEKQLPLQFKFLSILSPEKAQWLEDKKGEFSQEDLWPPRLITAKDLFKMGYSAGPDFSQIFRRLEDLQLEEEIRTKGEAREWVQQNFKV